MMIDETALWFHQSTLVIDEWIRKFEGLLACIRKFFSRNDGVFIYGFNKIFTFEEIIFSVERCIVEKKAFFCFILVSKSPISRERIETIATLILCIYYNNVKGTVHVVPLVLYIFQCENIVSSFISVRRLAMPDVGE